MGITFKETKIGQIPEEWELHQAKRVAFVNMGQSPSSSDCSDAGIGVPFLQGNADFGDKYPKISSWTTNPTKIAKPNDILMSVRAPVGDINLADTECCIGRGLCAITPKSGADLLFLYYILKSSMPRLLRFQQGSTFLAINKQNIDSHLIPLPPLPEQRKIAEILSTVDETIEKTDVIIEETKQLKKGLMQKLFTEGIGHSRFKETKIGQTPEEWEVVRLAKVSEIRFSNVDKKSYPGEIPVHLCNYLDVYNNESIDEKIDFMKATATTAEIEKFSLNKGDVIITKDSETADDIAVPSVVIEELNNVLCGYHLALLQPNAEKVDSIFLSKLLSSTPINNQFVRLAQGLTRFGLNVSYIQNAIIPLPSLDEQHQIAQILSEVDTKIETERAFKAELEQLKKGLMQVLLTGKIRVKV